MASRLHFWVLKMMRRPVRGDCRGRGGCGAHWLCVHTRSLVRMA